MNKNKTTKTNKNKHNKTTTSNKHNNKTNNNDTMQSTNKNTWNKRTQQCLFFIFLNNDIKHEHNEQQTWNITNNGTTTKQH